MSDQDMIRATAILKREVDSLDALMASGVLLRDGLRSNASHGPRVVCSTCKAWAARMPYALPQGWVMTVRMKPMRLTPWTGMRVVQLPDIERRPICPKCIPRKV